MSIHDLLFSTQRNQRIKRHVLLCIICYVFLIISYPPRGSGSANGIGEDGFIKFYEMVLVRSFFHLLCQMIFCYPIVYFLMPDFFWKKKYFQFVGMILLLLIAVSVFRYAAFTYAYNPIMRELKLYVNPVPQVFLFSIIQTINGPAFISFAFISIKFFKDWQQKQRDNFNLKKENANAELSLLKAQIHPHFLFNTLNNIYSFTLNKSQHAKYLVVKLEGMLHYIIEECEQQLVPSSKEIKLINDYIELEKVRYGNKLNIEVSIIADENTLITPLLIIPFVENSFKHGTSKILTNPWIKLNIETKVNVLHFSLSNSKPVTAINPNGKNGIGLSNVKKRLQLLYPQNHFFEHRINREYFYGKYADTIRESCKRKPGGFTLKTGDKRH